MNSVDVVKDLSQWFFLYGMKAAFIGTGRYWVILPSRAADSGLSGEQGRPKRWTRDSSLVFYLDARLEDVRSGRMAAACQLVAYHK